MILIYPCHQINKSYYYKISYNLQNIYYPYIFYTFANYINYFHYPVNLPIWYIILYFFENIK